MNNIETVKEYFEEIRFECDDITCIAVQNLSNRDKIQLFEHLKKSNVLYAGGDISENDISKVRNVMIKLWIKATENNKKRKQ